jgi:hypothetical protein
VVKIIAVAAGPETLMWTYLKTNYDSSITPEIIPDINGAPDAIGFLNIVVPPKHNQTRCELDLLESFIIPMSYPQPHNLFMTVNFKCGGKISKIA